jgi:hypothetical protein
MYPKVHLETQKTPKAKALLSKKEQCWRNHNTQLQTVLQSHSKKEQHGTGKKKKKNRYEDQWSRIEDPDINPDSYAHLIFEEGAENIQWKIASSTNVAGKSG